MPGVVLGQRPLPCQGGEVSAAAQEPEHFAGVLFGRAEDVSGPVHLVPVVGVKPFAHLLLADVHPRTDLRAGHPRDQLAHDGAPHSVLHQRVLLQPQCPGLQQQDPGTHHAPQQVAHRRLAGGLGLHRLGKAGPVLAQRQRPDRLRAHADERPISPVVHPTPNHRQTHAHRHRKPPRHRSTSLGAPGACSPTRVLVGKKTLPALRRMPEGG